MTKYAKGLKYKIDIYQDGSLLVYFTQCAFREKQYFECKL